MLNTHCYVVTSVDYYIGQSSSSFAHDVTYAEHRATKKHSLVYKANWSKKVHPRKDGRKCKYFWMALIAFFSGHN